MRTTLATLCVLLVVGGCERRGDRETGDELARSDDDTMAVTTAAVDTADAAINWGPAPPFLPAGAQAAVLDGDPSKPGPFRLQLDLPEGYQVRPHHHPMSEQVRVLEGTLLLGRGKEWADDKMSALAVGEEASVAPKEPHFIRAKERAVIEVRGTGPLEITYVNPADDPRKAPIQ